MNAPRPSHQRRRRRNRLAATALGGVGVALAFVLTPSLGNAASDSALPAQAGATQAAAPHVLDFAHGSLLPIRQLPSRTTRTEVPSDADGCDHAYGDVNQCIPQTFPAGVPNTPRAHCTWLRAHGYPPLTVHGSDPLKLDTDHDGTACGPHDAGAGG